MSESTTLQHPAKQEAIRQWTADPCGTAPGEPGTPDYFTRLLEMRHEYAPWMVEILDYQGCAGKDVLDVGSGQGIDLARYSAASARVVGIDLTPRHVELARAHLAGQSLGGTVVEGDAEALPFADGSFDRVSSNGVLHHTPDIEAALAEIHRVLRPGGEARVILYHRNSMHYWSNQVLFHGVIKRRLLTEGHMSNILSTSVEPRTDARPLVRVYRRREVRNMFRRAGFEDVRVLVRHFQESDSFLYDMLAACLPRLHAPATRDRIGRIAGWYVTGIGTKAPTICAHS